MKTERAEGTIQRAVKPFTPHSPSRKQRAFLELDVREAFYGGAAGGGKSDALIMAALQYVDVPGYNAILFRKLQKDLERADSIKARADSWFRGTVAWWNDKMYAWQFPTRNAQGHETEPATISFGYLEAVADRARYQGPAWQYIGVDEVVQWLIANYRWLFSRLRKTKAHGTIPLRLRSAGNPGGLGHEDFKERFVEHATHVGTGMRYRDFLALRRAGKPLPDPPYFVSPPSREAAALAEQLGIRAEGSYFVPAFSEDNPGLDRESYRMNLVQLDETERRHLDEGDWDVQPPGQIFQKEWFRYCDASEVPRAALLRCVRYWDFAATDPTKRKKPGKDPDWTAGVKVGVDQDATGATSVFIFDSKRAKKDPGDVEKMVRATADEDGRAITVWMEEEAGASGKANTFNYSSRVLVGYSVEGNRKTGPKFVYWKALASLAKAGRVYLVRGPWNAEFIRELVALQLDDSHAHDDQADAAAGALDRLLMSKDAHRARLMAKIS